MDWLWILIAVAVFIVLWWILTSNSFKRKKMKTEEASSGIEVALTKRYDTLVKMKDVAQGYAAHEKDVITNTIQIRKGMTVNELNEANVEMDKMARSIYAVAEGYPELRSSEVFLQLQDAIRDVEEHLQAARRLYNSNVTDYNTAIAMFPNSIVAGAMRLNKEPLFVADEHKKADVDMKF